MLYPSAPGQGAQCPDPQAGDWRCDLAVTPPFGADTIVTIASSARADELLGWLRAHHGRRDAALLPDLLANLVKTDPTVRIGFAGVFTNQRQRP